MDVCVRLGPSKGVSGVRDKERIGIVSYRGRGWSVCGPLLAGCSRVWERRWPRIPGVPSGPGEQRSWLCT